ncbi:ATP-binding cassette domain-containing protein [Agromyces larvae]|uniref:ABC transporter ATP-binding protein n=1 Tax=Agromyces larvae TaxID=2929802 RepID=A0ABY4BYK8_9MICO|nr:ATP-binding cassette domain-containing protein [Agromyces larvae]UOE42808.1 ABC transporter ATP-binding protein [Agromyces larvae]
MLRFRPEALRTAALLAAVFVAFRIAYRVLFDGAGGSGPVLLDPPEVRLPAPFGHVVLFGAVTLDGLWRAVVGAAPIALTILAFGALNAVVDISRLFARGARRGPVRGIARALVIAWATFPGLADAVRSVRLARRLRGERGAASLLVPVFERTVERAVAVAAAMEVRGFAAAHRVEGACERPVEVRGARMSRGGAWALEVDDLVLAPGALALVAGPTGSGKSTLLDGLSGLLSHVDGGDLSGTVLVGGVDRAAVLPRDTAGFVGVVLQNPRLGFAAETVDAEIGFALDVRGVAPVIVAARVAEIAGHVGIAHLLGRGIRALSAGEATLVAIAAALVERPSLLLVDEPLADLDDDARDRVVRLLDRLAHEAGVCVVVAEHRVDAFAGIADEVVSIAAGRAEAVGGELQRTSRGLETVAPLPPLPPRPAEGGGGAALVRVAGLSVAHGDREAVTDASLEVAAGEIVALAGPNGAGKSSLLTAIALPHDRGTVEVAGADVARLDRRRRRRAVVLVPEASDDLLLALTVREECRRADRAAHAPAGATAARFAAFLGLTADSPDATRLLAAHPRDLSAGERRVLALALQLAAGARVLMVDEPTRGLDADACALVGGALGAVAAAGGAVVIATHDGAFASAVADRIVPMVAGRVGGRVGAGGSAGAADTTSRDAPPRRVGAPRPAVAVPAGRAAPRDRAPRPARRIHPLVTALALVLGNLIAAVAFAWPFFTPALPSQAQAAAPFAAIALTPFLLAVLVLVLDDRVRSAKLLAMLGTLTAVGAAVRIASTGVGGVEAVFVLLITAGRVFGARFGFLLGVLVIALSSVLQGGVGPWTPFQMFACAWVGAGAGLLPRLRSTPAEIALLSVYGVIASYVFGLAMNLWFWPFAVGAGTAVSYDGAAPFAQNLTSFLLYSFVTSTAGWDTLRAVTTVIGLVVAGPAVLAALRRTRLTPSAGSRSLRRTSRPPRAPRPGAGRRAPRPDRAPTPVS